MATGHSRLLRLCLGSAYHSINGNGSRLLSSLPASELALSRRLGKLSGDKAVWGTDITVLWWKFCAGTCRLAP